MGGVEVDRVHRLAGDACFEVQVRPGAAAFVSVEGDELSCLDGLPYGDDPGAGAGRGVYLNEGLLSG